MHSWIFALFHLKGSQYEFVFYEVARSACAWSLLFHIQGLKYEFVFNEATKRVCMVFYYSICKDYSTVRIPFSTKRVCMPSFTVFHLQEL